MNSSRWLSDLGGVVQFRWSQLGAEVMLPLRFIAPTILVTEASHHRKYCEGISVPARETAPDAGGKPGPNFVPKPKGTNCRNTAARLSRPVP